MTAHSETDLCECQRIFETLFTQLLPSKQFRALVLAESAGENGEHLGQIASSCEQWATPLVQHCVVDLMTKTQTKQGIFRLDEPEMRCLKSVLASTFNAVVLEVLQEQITSMLTRGSKRDPTQEVKKILNLLASVQWPNLILIAANTICAETERKFVGGGKVGLVGLFFLRLLCPLILKEAARPNLKPARVQHLLETTKCLQSLVNAFSTAESEGEIESNPLYQKVSCVLYNLLQSPCVEEEGNGLPNLAATRAFASWILHNSFLVGKQLKGDAGFNAWIKLTTATRESLQDHTHPESESPRSSQGHKHLPRTRSTLGALPIRLLTTSHSEPQLPVPHRRVAKAATSSELTRSVSISALAPRAGCSRVPVKTDRTILPDTLRALQLDTDTIRAWTEADITSWLAANDLLDLLPLFREHGIGGEAILAMSKSSSFFSDNGVKIGLIKSFFRAQEILFRSTKSLFTDHHFTSEQEQILALKEFIYRLGGVPPV